VIGRRRRGRPDASELAAERLQAGREPFEPLPPTLRRLDRKRLLLYLVLGAVTVAVLRDGLGRGAPPVKGSCTQPAFAFDRTEVREDGVVKWSVAGPPDAQVVITADSTTADGGRLLGPVTLQGCKASGRFGVVLQDGTHVLRVFLRQPDGTTQVIGTRTIVVNAPR
jgi:hypothetical protein